jgi:hypothetical protein
VSLTGQADSSARVFLLLSHKLLPADVAEASGYLDFVNLFRQSLVQQTLAFLQDNDGNEKEVLVETLRGGGGRQCLLCFYTQRGSFKQHKTGDLLRLMTDHPAVREKPGPQFE